MQPTCGLKKPDSPPPLEEEYTYIDVKLNVGLKDSDFNPDKSRVQVSLIFMSTNFLSDLTKD